MNMEFVGPNLYLAPEVLPDDGLLDVVLVAARERDKLEASLVSWQDGELRHPELTRYRAAKIELEWTGFEVHFDDEAWPGGKTSVPSPAAISIGVERDAIEFLAPAATATTRRAA
jgi:diacylglycerol kinase family enzyme